MPVETKQFNSVTLARVPQSFDLKGVLKDSWLNVDAIIVKPNWVGTNVGLFTDCETLRMLIEALDCRIIVTEAYQIHRIPAAKASDVVFKLDGEDRTLRWLQKEGWFWIEKNSNWDWFKEKGLWDHLRKLDRWFRDEYGFTDLFNKYGVEYVNITEEIWQGRGTDPEKVRDSVEGKYKPVSEERMYGFVPQKLYDLREATFISLAKVKNYETFTIKNLFGLIPDPIRAWWHGPENRRFDESIVGITKIYASLFRLYGVCEALRKTATRHSEGEFGEGNFRYKLKDAPEVLAFGRNLAALDAVVCSSFNMKLGDLSYLKGAEEVFGVYSDIHLEDVKVHASDWLSTWIAEM